MLAAYNPPEPLYMLKSGLEEPNTKFTLNLLFCQLCFEVLLCLLKVSVGPFLKAGTIAIDAENAESPIRYSFLLKYFSFDN